MMTIKLYNTLSRKIEEFHSLVPNHVGFYSCGPTVYWNQHLGNMRTFINNDMLKRMFIANGYSVTHVMNFTDVGHLTSDEDEGEDKMEKGSKRENKSVWDVAQMYINSVTADMNELNIIPPTYTPRATDYIKQQIDLIKKLEELGYTYEIPGDGIYYDTSKFAHYGELGGQDLSELRAGARVSAEGKRNPTDFGLWKFSPKDEKRQMEWESPWGVGFPGWHIECSAMSMDLLGDHFDIHTGGKEHIKVHHTDEIAQTEPIVGRPWVNYWVHWEWLMAKDGKMSKSAGDSLTVPYIKNLGYDPMHFRYLILLGHYRQPIEFSFAALDAARNGYDRIIRKVSELLSAQGSADDKLETWKTKLLEPINNNLKTAESIVVFQEMLRDSETSDATKLDVIKFADDLFGLDFVGRAKKLLSENNSVPDEIKKLADERMSAKQNRDFSRADSLRQEIESMGWMVTDGKGGYNLIKK